jgi:VIT1/CCC1 family predicted Fe2+/Mn2+ transporter
MNGPIQRVVVVDLRISFFRLMMFFVKATLAAIPAAIIVTIVLMALGAVVAVLMGGSPSYVIRRWQL